MNKYIDYVEEYFRRVCLTPVRTKSRLRINTMFGKNIKILYMCIREGTLWLMCWQVWGINREDDLFGSDTRLVNGPY